ncbi:MAG: hypothetical protein JKY22_06040 [Flavobacteriaceae bacterium]|nr:hypothetical protein [Flavobacteriaceae bacterium]
MLKRETKPTKSTETKNNLHQILKSPNLFQFNDNRSSSRAHEKLQSSANNSQQSKQLNGIQKLINDPLSIAQTVQLQPVIQLQKGIPINSNSFGDSVTGPSEIIEVFDELMKNKTFKEEVAQYLKTNKFLILIFFGYHSNFSFHKRQILINEKYEKKKEKIRGDLTFELHNATSTNIKKSLEETNKIPSGKKSNKQKIKQARITEFTEWLNIARIGGKMDDGPGGNMGFEKEHSLVTNLKSHYLTFENYLHYQLSSEHTQKYLDGVFSETQGDPPIDLSKKDSVYYKKEIPSLFLSLPGEDAKLKEVLGKMNPQSEVRKRIEWSKERKTTQIKKDCNLRKLDHAVDRQMKKGEVIRVLDKNKKGNYFSTTGPWTPQWQKHHYWIQTPDKNKGWVMKDAVEE